ncbi:hypothetical protein FB566_3709 [Stackebrandtia endophytica]|uniref:Uncharacterized protein n=1 Tax=Stackebrandtia endophytica TaxID=1496996 RepID=A0A543AZW4_9ACTN|nr:hypothetical protein [Stackebrandtia endophytica]TQL78132.1 hypothetical protein FB566_3709 [Stackebrandtia endophytica]
MSQQNHEVASPDGQIRATVIGGTLKGLTLAPGAYRGYGDAELGNQLVQVARLVWVARERSRKQAMRAVVGDPRAEVAERTPKSSAERRLRERRDSERVEVSSRHMKIGIIGGTKWAIHIEPGTVKKLSEEAFLTELVQLVKQAMGAWRSTMSRLRRECFGPSEILRTLKFSR